MRTRDFIKATPKKQVFKKIPPREILLFFRQLAALVMAGIPMMDAMSLLEKNAKESSWSTCIRLLKENLNAGKELSQGMRQFPRYFDPISCSLIHAGEKSGTLDSMLQRIALHKEKILQLKNTIKQAVFYPALIVITAIVTSIIMLTVVVPRFAELFDNMHRQLPVFTVFVISLSQGLCHFFWAIILLIVVMIIGWRVCSPITRGHLLLRIPGIGILLQKMILTRLAETLSTLLIAGIPLAEALSILHHTLGNAAFAKALHHLHHDIQLGKSLHDSMQTCPLFPMMMLQMVRIGEESGSLADMLVKTAQFYESEIACKIATLTKLLEPLIMMILGVLIGGLVIAMYLPIFKLGTVF